MESRLPVHRLAERLAGLRMTRRAWILCAQVAGIAAGVAGLMAFMSTPAWRDIVYWVAS